MSNNISNELANININAVED
ncbi:hypothetical protein, partial, partial [Absidia glauca]